MLPAIIILIIILTIVLISSAIICIVIVGVKHPELEELELQEQETYLKHYMNKKEKK